MKLTLDKNGRKERRKDGGKEKGMEGGERKERKKKGTIPVSIEQNESVPGISPSGPIFVF